MGLLRKVFSNFDLVFIPKIIFLRQRTAAFQISGVRIKAREEKSLNGLRSLLLVGTAVGVG